METTTIRLVTLVLASAVVGASATAVYLNVDLRSPFPTAAAALPMGVERNFTLEIVGADLDMGGGVTWHAWTYNGTVPGPTLKAVVGDVIHVTVKNTLNMTHSFHTHLSPYALESDGSQLNTISGIGGMAMIPPGGEYTYSYVANEAGLYYYHCHSADGGRTISQHMAQGLYGAIIVTAREEAPIRDEVVFMAERGFNVSGPGSATFIMNGHGMPGGEHELENAFHHGGVDAVTAALGTIVPTVKGKVGEPIRFNVINIGDQVHSFHMHAMTAYDPDTGKPIPAQVAGLVPGEVSRFVVTPNQPGLWLFHCHVVYHADGGMIGVFQVAA